MGQNITVNITKVNLIADAKGVDTLIVRALAGLSKPVRAGILAQLRLIKVELKGKITTLGFRNKILKRKQTDAIAITQGKAQAELSKIKRILGSLNIGPDFLDNEGLQTVIGLLLSNVKVKGLSIGGYKDMDNVLITANFNIRQLERAANLTEIAAKAMNSKIDEIGKIIEVIDALGDIASAS